MGRDKARLPFRGRTLAEFVALTVESAAGTAVLVGDPSLYEEFGYPVIPDRFPGQGPLGGILTALHHTAADWNLVVACDMPGLSVEFLKRLFETAERSQPAALVPAGPSGRPEPLCALYHRGALEALESAFHAGQRKVTAALAGIRTEILPVKEVSIFQNVNTPEEWLSHGRG